MRDLARTFLGTERVVADEVLFFDDDGEWVAVLRRVAEATEAENRRLANQMAARWNAVADALAVLEDRVSHPLMRSRNAAEILRRAMHHESHPSAPDV